MPPTRLPGPVTLAIRDALNPTVTALEDLQELLLAIDLDVNEVPLTGTMKQILLGAVLAVHKKGLILQLIAEARRRAPDDGAIAAVERSVAALLAPYVVGGGDPFQACLLTAGQIMVDRKHLRRALVELSRPLGKRVLVVRDGPAMKGLEGTRVRTGKSHTTSLVTHVAQSTGAFRPVVVDLEDLGRAVGSGKLIEPHDLAKQITAPLGCKRIVMPPPIDSQWARWILDFCGEFEDAFRDADQTWIVIDQFHLVPLPQQTADLVKDLAKRIATTLPNFRLVLLGYAGSLHPSTLPEEEALHLIDEAELVEFFLRASQERRAGLTPGEIASNVQSALRGLDLSHPEYHGRLGAQILAEMERWP